jgi:hypothetical protein
MAEQQPLVATTGAGEYELPVEFVTLTGRALRRKDGAPFVVRVDFIDEDELLKLIEATPGHAPQLGVKKPASEEERENIAIARGLLKYAPGILGASCVLVGPNGEEQRPAFHFGPDPKDGSLPARFLTTPEKLRLLMTSLRVSGFVGGPADDLRFPSGKRAGGDTRGGTVGTGSGDGDASGGTPVRAEEGGAAPPDAGSSG